MEKSNLITKKTLLETVSFGVVFFLLTLGMDYFSDHPIELRSLAIEAIFTMIVYGIFIMLLHFFSERKRRKESKYGHH
ncbi:hypothetical protein [Carnobacterium inhibens]|uniref:hypothetical protein n=1 Tax=Carnobacterium inhibens TaxID=147709 RepID=UPI0005520710|nr:hypothetical protein [Carnobacterium inhibens]